MFPLFFFPVKLAKAKNFMTNRRVIDHSKAPIYSNFLNISTMHQPIRGLWWRQQWPPAKISSSPLHAHVWGEISLQAKQQSWQPWFFEPFLLTVLIFSCRAHEEQFIALLTPVL